MTSSKAVDEVNSESAKEESSEPAKAENDRTDITDMSMGTDSETKMAESQVHSEERENSGIVQCGSFEHLVENAVANNPQNNVETPILQETAEGDKNDLNTLNDAVLSSTEIIIESKPSPPLAALVRTPTKVAVENDNKSIMANQDHSTNTSNQHSESDAPKMKAHTKLVKGGILSVSSHVISFPPDGEIISRNKVKLFPSKFSKAAAVGNTTKFRLSLETRKKAQDIPVSNRAKPITKMSGLNGWNLPQHLVKQRMKGLESSQEYTVQLLKYNQMKGDSISSLIEKYQKNDKNHTTIIRQKSRTITSREKQKSGSHEQVEKRVDHLEKLKHYEKAFDPGAIPDSKQEHRYYKYSKKDREVDMWLHHVQYQHHKKVRQKMQLAGLPSQQHSLQYHGVAPLGGARDQGHFVYMSDTVGRYYDFQGRLVSATNYDYCPTVPKCEVEIEGTPLNWIAGKGCGEWKPFSKGRSYGQSERIENRRRSVQQEESPKKKEDVNSLVDLLYDEVLQGGGESKENSADKAENVEEMKNASNKESEELYFVPKTAPKTKARPTGISSTVNIVMAAAKLAKKRRGKQDDKPDLDSILMKELDDDAIRKGSEFRG